jgi:CheY-like chemotaxis protein
MPLGWQRRLATTHVLLLEARSISMSRPAAGRILLIENDADVRESLALLLEAKGYQVAAAGDGRAAVACLQGFLLPHLILLDLRMPEMNGWEFLEHRERDPFVAHIPVVIMSGASDALETAGKVGAADCLIKPFAFSRLQSIVQRFCN